ncbi:MAG: D-aminoacylase [Acidobacteria bacterium]|nr:D-aminoacylase [Acidobacteriota bacterium]
MSHQVMTRSAAALLLTMMLALSGAAQETYDIIIRNGKVIDGTGNPWIRADVGIRGDRIVRIGDLSNARAQRVIDARNLIVAPGFIDPHTHASGGIQTAPTAESALLQGVTTLTENNDGGGSFPIAAALAEIQKLRISPNWALYVGHNTIRQRVMGNVNRAPTAAELEKMRQMVAQAMEEGALGLSTGLFYTPGAFAKTDEVIELSKVAAKYRGMYISHMRNEAEGLSESVSETIRIGEEAGLPVQMTHHKASGKNAWGSSVQSLKMVDEARARGVDITMDQYPYTASATSIEGGLVPQWAREGSNEDQLKRLRDPATRARIKADIVHNIVFVRGGGDPKNVYISQCRWDPSLAGKNLAQIAQDRGMAPTPDNAAEVVMDIVEKGGAGAIYHAMSEEDVERIMKHPATAIGSDGGVSKIETAQGVPHPRQYGTFARVLGVYVRERRVIGLEEAIRKMSNLTAQRLGIRDRGLLREGFFADIAVFDADRIKDMSTFTNPHQYAVGVQYVLVNGEVVVQEGKHSGVRPGRILYGPGYKRN